MAELLAPEIPGNTENWELMLSPPSQPSSLTTPEFAEGPWGQNGAH